MDEQMDKQKNELSNGQIIGWIKNLGFVLHIKKTYVIS